MTFSGAVTRVLSWSSVAQVPSLRPIPRHLYHEQRWTKTRWRTGRDSNPRWLLHHARFPSVCLKPLGHLSFWARSAALIARRQDRATASFLGPPAWLGWVGTWGIAGGFQGGGVGSVGDGRRRHRARRVDLVDGRFIPSARPGGPVVAPRRPLAGRRAGSPPAPSVVGPVDLGRAAGPDGSRPAGLRGPRPAVPLARPSQQRFPRGRLPDRLAALAPSAPAQPRRAVLTTERPPNPHMVRTYSGRPSSSRRIGVLDPTIRLPPAIEHPD